MTPESFLDDILSQLHLKHLIIGDDFRFGAQRAGDFELLKNWGKNSGTNVIAHETVSKGGERISSTRIRQALLNDDFEGGEFEIQTTEKNVVQLKKKDVIIFHADTPHRVKPVTKGVRHSLVGWTQGPAYK